MAKINSDYFSSFTDGLSACLAYVFAFLLVMSPIYVHVGKRKYLRDIEANVKQSQHAINF